MEEDDSTLASDASAGGARLEYLNAVAVFALIKVSRGFKGDEIAILDSVGDMWRVRFIRTGEADASTHVNVGQAAVHL